LETQLGTEIPVAVRLQTTGNAYLGTITNESITTDILLWLEQDGTVLPNGNIVALDVGAKNGGQESNAGVFMIVSLPEGENTMTRNKHKSLHKLGVTNAVLLLPEGTETAEAKLCNAHISRAESQRFFIGGKSCHACYPAKNTNST
jgi:hypothetical protein